jgi:NAD(P)-dependent dehydrogenase (short-subunit alcohol dehydrogenase family)
MSDVFADDSDRAAGPVAEHQLQVFTSVVAPAADLRAPDEERLVDLRPVRKLVDFHRGMVESGGGSIVCVGTRAALQPFSGAAGYVASKAAVITFAKAVAVEYRDDGIRCNAILPSVIDTPANRASMPDAEHDRWVKPAEIAAVIAHLISNESSPVSGAAIPVYGRA